MAFFKYFLLKGFLASSLLGSHIFCNIVEQEFVIKDGEWVEVEEGKGIGHFGRFSDQGMWSLDKRDGIVHFWVLEIEFGNGRAKTYFLPGPTDKDHPKICAQNVAFYQEFIDYKSGIRLVSTNRKFIQSENSNGWSFLYGKSSNSSKDVIKVDFWENPDHNSYLASCLYTDIEIYKKREKLSVSVWDKFKEQLSKLF